MEEKILKEVAQYKIDLANNLSEILKKALLKPAAMEQLEMGLREISFDESVKPRPISPFNPDYMDELMSDLEEYVSKYANSKEYADLMDNKRKNPEFIESIFIPDGDKATTEKFMAAINQFTKLLENIEDFLLFNLDPLLIDPRYLDNEEKFADLISLLGKTNAIVQIEIVPCVYPLLYMEYDLRDEEYYGDVYSRADGLTYYIALLTNIMCDISNTLNEMDFRDKVEEDDEVEADE
jgi:hypothetical protein